MKSNPVATAIEPPPESGLLLVRLIEKLEAALIDVSRRVALLAVAAILIISISTIVDIILRNFFRTTLFGLNEITALLVAVAASTCLPYGLAKGSVLSIDLLSGRFSPGLRAWLAVLTPTLVFIYFLLLAFRVFETAEIMRLTRETTMITLTPKAPFFFVMAGSCLVVALTQGLTALRLLVPTLAQSGWPARIAALVVAAIGVHTLLVLFGAANGAVYQAIIPGTRAGLAVLSLLVLWVMILLGFPIGIIMGLIGLWGASVILGPNSALEVLGSETALFITRDGFSVLPLFLLMGAFAGVAGIGTDLYKLSNALLGHIRGGLAHASILACGLFGTLTGSSIATQMSVGKIALEEMQRHKYSTALSAGSVAAGGTLGQLIPPSSALILYAILTEQSVGQLFVGAIIPGILAVVLYMGSITVWLWLRPQDAQKHPRSSLREIAVAGRSSWSVLLLLGTVLGGIYGGIFTDLEAGSVGAAGAFLIALFRGRLTRASFWKTIGDSTGSLAMIYSLIFGVVMLSFFFGISGVPAAFTSFINGLNLSPMGVVLALVCCYIVLGTIMDPFAMMVITIPFFVPLVTGLGFDPIWWGILTIICMEAGMISPPFGLNMFVIASLDKSIPMSTVYRGSWPFFASTLVKILLLLAIPGLVTWLPSTM